MAKHVKNLQLFYEKHPQLIAHQRPMKPDFTRGKLHDINFWKIFSKMPRDNSNLHQTDLKQQQNQNQQGRFIVISNFKNSQTTTESPIKNIKVYKNHIKRYISDQGLNFTRKISRNKIISDEQIKIESKKPVENVQKTKQKQSSLSEQFQRSAMITYSKRTVVSGNQSEIKAKYRISKDLSKKQNRAAAVQKINSKRKLPDIKQKKYPLLMRDPQQLKQVKSQSYIVLEYPSERIVVSHRSVVSLEIASLTKIMTFYTVYCIIQQRNINIKTETVTVTHQASQMTGTSAQLIEGEVYTIEDLLYGLMLPSGNDAANQLAFWTGSFLINSDDLKAKQKAFIIQMNRRAKSLDLKNSKFANAHGLPNQEARSTASDMAKLCCICMKNQLFRTVVSCKKYKTFSKYLNTVRQVEWQNTNKLLRRDGFLGIKTGITVTAGPCLAAAFTFRDKVYISVVLRAPKVSGRFKQTRILLNWCFIKLFTNLSEQQKNKLKKLKKNDPELDSDYSQDEHEFNYDRPGAGQYKKRVNILNYQL